MSTKKRIRCQICGDEIPGARQRNSVCLDCQQRTTQPPEGAPVAREFTCADCGVRFILATGELVAHGDTRFCLTCWRAQRYTTRIVGVSKDDIPITRQESIRTSVPLWAIELGLNWPCTLDDVEHRGKELAKAHHPDRPGGDHAAFVIKREYVEQARAYFVQQSEQGVLL